MTDERTKKKPENQRKKEIQRKNKSRIEEKRKWTIEKRNFSILDINFLLAFIEELCEKIENFEEEGLNLFGDSSQEVMFCFIFFFSPFCLFVTKFQKKKRSKLKENQEQRSSFYLFLLHLFVFEGAEFFSLLVFFFCQKEMKRNHLFSLFCFSVSSFSLFVSHFSFKKIPKPKAPTSYFWFSDLGDFLAFNSGRMIFECLTAEPSHENK